MAFPKVSEAGLAEFCRQCWNTKWPLWGEGGQQKKPDLAGMLEHADDRDKKCPLTNVDAFGRVLRPAMTTSWEALLVELSWEATARKVI